MLQEPLLRTEEPKVGAPPTVKAPDPDAIVDGSFEVPNSGSLTCVDPHALPWSFGVASEVFLRAGSFTLALLAAQQAAVAAEACCESCLAWARQLEIAASEAYINEHDDQAVPPTIDSPLAQ